MTDVDGGDTDTKIALVELILDNGRTVRATITVHPYTDALVPPVAGFTHEFGQFMDYFIHGQETQDALKEWLHNASS